MYTAEMGDLYTRNASWVGGVLLNMPVLKDLVAMAVMIVLAAGIVS